MHVILDSVSVYREASTKCLLLSFIALMHTYSLHLVKCSVVVFHVIDLLSHNFFISLSHLTNTLYVEMSTKKISDILSQCFAETLPTSSLYWAVGPIAPSFLTTCNPARQFAKFILKQLNVRAYCCKTRDTDLSQTDIQSHSVPASLLSRTCSCCLLLHCSCCLLLHPCNKEGWPFRFLGYHITRSTPLICYHLSVHLSRPPQKTLHE